MHYENGFSLTLQEDYQVQALAETWKERRIETKNTFIKAAICKIQYGG